LVPSKSLLGFPVDSLFSPLSKLSSYPRFEIAGEGFCFRFPCLEKCTWSHVSLADCCAGIYKILLLRAVKSAAELGLHHPCIAEEAFTRKCASSKLLSEDTRKRKGEEAKISYIENSQIFQLKSFTYVDETEGGVAVLAPRIRHILTIVKTTRQEQKDEVRLSHAASTARSRRSLHRQPRFPAARTWRQRQDHPQQAGHARRPRLPEQRRSAGTEEGRDSQRKPRCSQRTSQSETTLQGRGNDV